MLAKAYGGGQYLAFNRMINTKTGKVRCLKVLKRLKEAASEQNRINKTGNTYRQGSTHTEEANEKNRIAHNGRKDTAEAKANKKAAQLDPITRENNRQKHLGKKHTEETKIAIGIGAQRPCSEDKKKKISLANTGKVRTDEMRAKNSASRMGKGTGKRDTCECPHCHKVGGIGCMKRYHFDNCKSLHAV